jgi:hypothetical protein
MSFLELTEKHPSPWMFAHLCNMLNPLDQEEIQVRIQEFMKFMYLFSMKNGGFIPVADEIDHIWHEYIVQTREYEQLCKNLPGQKFVHHQTISFEDYSKTKDRTQVLKEMLDWVPEYYACFGEFTETTAPYWRVISFLSNELHLTLQQINDMAKNKISN